jgi:hypothetical protein
MGWPTPQDYSEAVQSPRTAFEDAELQRGVAEMDRFGIPRPRSGAFATVYKIICPTRHLAVRCFTHPVSDEEERYAAIASHLSTVRLQYLADFSFLRAGIRVGGQPYPVLKMEWIDGEPLIPYVQRNLGNPAVLLALAARWCEMVKSLRQCSIAHGDLQHGNVLIANGDIKLVDYDGMFVPGLAGRGGRELGQRNYQHPMRTDFDYGPALDNFSSWVVYISLILLAKQPQLWSQFGGGDECLLFRREDFDHPEASAIFSTLEKSRVDGAHPAITFFRYLLDLSPSDVPALDGRAFVGKPERASEPSVTSWIADYVSQPKVTLVADTQQVYFDPAPSWIQDFVAPSGPRTEFVDFRNSVSPQRMALGISVGAIVLTTLLLYFHVLSIMAARGLTSTACIMVFGVWVYGFRSDRALKTLQAVRREFKSASRRVERSRAVVRSKEAQKKTVAERSAFDRQKASANMDALRLAERAEIEKAEAALQLEKLSINARRKGVNQQEAAELQALSARLGPQATALANKISGLIQAETAELTTALATQQAQYVRSYLQRFIIDNAKVPGIGPGYKTRLLMAGILSAADIDHRIYGVKGIGSTRSSALIAWHQSLRTAAQGNMPKALSAREVDPIKAKYAAEQQALQAPKSAVENQIRAAENAIRTKYRLAREALDIEELAAGRNHESTTGAVRLKYRPRHEALANYRGQVEEDLKRKVEEIDQSCAAERRNLFALRWEEEKSRRRLDAFAEVTFRRYLGHVFGLA